MSQLISPIQKRHPVPIRTTDLKAVAKSMEPTDSVVCASFNLAQALRAAGKNLGYKMRTAREPEKKRQRENEIRGTRNGHYRVWRIA